MTEQALPQLIDQDTLTPRLFVALTDSELSLSLYGKKPFSINLIEANALLQFLYDNRTPLEQLSYRQYAEVDRLPEDNEERKK